MKLLAAVMAAAVLLASCVAPPSEEPVSTATGAAGQPTVPASASTEPLKDIELSVFTLEANANSADADNYAQDSVAKAIYDKLKIKLKYLKAASSTVDEQASLMMASGKYSDIFIGTMGHSYVQNMLSSGKVYDMEDLSNKYAPDLLTRYERFISLWKQKLNVGGKLVAMALDAGCDDATQLLGQADWGVWMRYDLMKQIGNPEIKTMDDVFNALVKMKEQFPVISDGRKALVTTGFLKEDWGFEWGLMMPWTSGQGIYNLDGVYYTPDYSGKAITLGAPEDTLVYYQAARWYNKLYRAGLFDPDAFSKTYDDVIAEYNSGRYYVSIGGNDISSAEAYFTANGHPEWIYNAYSPRANGYTGKPLWYYLYAEDNGRTWTAIPVTNEYPERTMQLLDFMVSDAGQELMGRGVAGETFDLADGKYVMRDDFIASMQNDAQSTIWRTGVTIFSPYWDHRAMNKTNDQPYDYTLDVSYVTAGYTDAMKQMLQETNQTFRGEITRRREYNIGGEWLAFAQGITLPDELSQAREEVRQALFGEYLSKLILAKDDAEFDRMVQACQAKLNASSVKDGIPGYKRLSSYYEQLWIDNKDFIQNTMNEVGYQP
jgi:putative aldouronate transport system substrate-binding protein